MRTAFSLIELLVVIAIISLLSSMIFINTNEVSDELNVQIAARELQATFAKARALAIKTGNVHAVTFHVENAGDGRVMRNFEESDPAEFQGRHWYAIIGPQVEQRNWSRSQPPDPRRNSGRTIEEFETAVELAMIGRRHYLPRGTRFLAIGDQDFGTFPNWQFYRDANRWLDVYPRPWFGVLKPASSAHPAPPSGSGNNFILYSWGGYDMEWEAAQKPAPSWATNGSGVQRSPYPRSGFNRRGDLDGTGLPVTWADGPIIRGLQMDVVAIFFADGRCTMEPKFRAQRYLIHDNSWDGKHRIGNNSAIDGPIGMRYGACGPEHDVRATGGYHVTITRDVDTSEDIYPHGHAERFDIFRSEEDAVKSITPFRRVFLHQDTSQVEIRNEQDPYCQMQMNQRNLLMSDVGVVPPDGSMCTVYRPAHRNVGFTLRIDASLQDAEWTEDGWKGWFPPYAP